MAGRNLTIQLDDELVRRAKIVAAKRGMSVSGLVAQQLRDSIAADERHEAAAARVLEAIHHAENHGGRTWTRDELYDRPIARG